MKNSLFVARFYPQGKPFYPTDHCGVLRVWNENIHPRYMARILENGGKKLRFSRSFRASLGRVAGISFIATPYDMQQGAMEQIAGLEKEISEREAALRKLDAKESDVFFAFTGENLY